MAQFDVHHFAERNGPFPYIVDLQDDFLEGLETRMAAPLYPLAGDARRVLRLNPAVEVGGTTYYVAIQRMSALRVKTFGQRVASVEGQRDEIIAAIDFLFTGV